jgi:3-oxoacyl-[acyl-carrier protein] reductase
MTPAPAPAVFVAGGAGGVGAGIVGSWLAAGATVVTVSRDEARLDRLREEVGAGDRGRLVTARGSASDPRVVASLAEEHGPFDQIVASIGGGGWALGPLQEMDAEMFATVILDGITAHWQAAQTLRPYLKSDGSHVFVNGGAVIDIVPGTGPLSLVARAQLTMAEIFDVEHPLPKPRTVSLILASPVATPQRGSRVESEWLTPRDVGDACVLIHRGVDASGSITITTRSDIARLRAQ